MQEICLLLKMEMYELALFYYKSREFLYPRRDGEFFLYYNEHSDGNIWKPARFRWSLHNKNPSRRLSQHSKASLGVA